MLSEAKKYVLALQRMDAREVARAQRMGVNPILFVSLGDVSISTQLTAVLQRINDALAAKVSGSSVPVPGGGPS